MVQVTRYGLFLATFFLTACQTVPEQPTQAERNDRSQVSTPSEQQIEKVKPKITDVDNVVTLSPAVSKLLQQAEVQQQSGSNTGNYNAAIATLERAIRIAPRYPESYYRLAKIRFQQGSYAQALSLAQKAISLGASGNLKQQSLSLIAISSNN